METANNAPLDTGQARGAITVDTTHAALHHAPAHSAPPAMSSAPHTPSVRRTSHPATSPIPTERYSPRPAQTLRRTSSSQSLNKPPPSSPQLARKGSRSSLGGTPDAKDRRPTPKRSISNLIAGLREAHSTMESIEEPIPLTAPQIAADHFTKELARHSLPEHEAETLVLMHDACYGHRYSRLKATKTTLALIVERPERLHASLLGASTAYVRLGGHHAEGRHAPHPDYQHTSRPAFNIRRTARSIPITSSYVTNVHGTTWMSELQGMCESAPQKLAAGIKELTRESVFGEPEKTSLHEGDLYLAPESLHAFQGALGGVADAVDAVFSEQSRTRRAFVAVRPPGHHCSADLPSGFCWLNNVHVGIEYAAQMHGLTHAAILDFDLHHGDGSQAITWQRNSKNNEKRLYAKANSKLKFGPDIGYYSLHDINSYPCEMGDNEKVQAASLCIENAHGQSVWNVHLQPWKTEDEFWSLYEDQYSVLIDKAKNFLLHHNHRIRAEGKSQPRSAIFLSAGFDASEWEGSGMQRHKVNVPTEFYARFTQDVVKIAQQVPGCQGRVISVLEGGYSDRALCTGALSHIAGLCTASVTVDTDGVGSLLRQMNGLAINGTGSDSRLQYDKAWWSAANMTALENKVYPPPPPQAKKGRTGPQPTYATPTESFAYKVVDPQKFARSVSGTMRDTPVPARPPTPPPPEVDWVVATQELSNLLIPTDRQTKSCTPEELAPVRTKKERQSDMPALSTEQAGRPRQLRDRRTKGPLYAESAHSDETESMRAVSRTESRSSRRETIDVLPSEAPAATSSRRLSRRLSAGSALSTTSSLVDANAPPVPTLPPQPAASTVTNAMKPPAIPAPRDQPHIAKVRSTSNRMPPPSRTNSNSADMDRITSGMKKVTLKVSASKEEHDRKQKEKVDAQRRASALKGAETRRMNAAAKKAAKDAAAQPAPPKREVVTTSQMHKLDQKESTTAAAGTALSPASTTPNPMDIDLTMSHSATNEVAKIGATFPDAQNHFTAPAEMAIHGENDPKQGQTVSATHAPQNTIRIDTLLNPVPPSDSLEHGEQMEDSGKENRTPDIPLHTSKFETHSLSTSQAPATAPGTYMQIPRTQLQQDVIPQSSTCDNSSVHESKLPVWSSTGPIPFARPANPSSSASVRGDAGNGWDVPDTPAK